MFLKLSAYRCAMCNTNYIAGSAGQNVASLTAHGNHTWCGMCNELSARISIIDCRGTLSHPRRSRCHCNDKCNDPTKCMTSLLRRTRKRADTESNLHSFKLIAFGQSAIENCHLLALLCSLFIYNVCLCL